MPSSFFPNTHKLTTLIFLVQLLIEINCKPGADPGFPVGGGTDPLGGGANIRFCQIFRKSA